LRTCSSRTCVSATPPCGRRPIRTSRGKGLPRCGRPSARQPNRPRGCTDAMLFAPPATGATDVARRLADYVLLRHSPAVPLAATDYWEASVPAYERICELVARLAEQLPAITSSYLRLVGAPDDCRAHYALASALAELLGRESDLCATAASAVREADQEI